MRDIYKTVKKMQTTPVSDRVKAMLAQPRGVPQARKIARQTLPVRQRVMLTEERCKKRF